MPEIYFNFPPRGYFHANYNQRKFYYARSWMEKGDSKRLYFLFIFCSFMSDSLIIWVVLSAENAPSRSIKIFYSDFKTFQAIAFPLSRSLAEIYQKLLNFSFSISFWCDDECETAAYDVRRRIHCVRLLSFHFKKSF